MRTYEKLEKLYLDEVIGYGAEAFDPETEADDLQEFLEELEDTEQIDMLEALFKAGIELYLVEDGEVVDCPMGELHFIGKDGKIYNAEYEVVSAKDFRAKYCPISKVKQAMKKGDYDSEVFTFEGDEVVWTIINELDCYVIE